MTIVQPRAVFCGALIATLIALPAGLAGQIIVGRGETASGVVALAFLVPILVAFGVGGFVAARRAASGPLTNGALAGVSSFVFIQGLGVARRLAGGEGVSTTSMVFAALLACSCGLLGAAAAAAQRPGSAKARGTGDGGPTADARS